MRRAEVELPAARSETKFGQVRKPTDLEGCLCAGDAQADYLARLCAVRRAETELPAAGAEHEAAQAAAQLKRVAPPAALLAWLKAQPPSAVVTGKLCGSCPTAADAICFAHVSSHTCRHECHCSIGSDMLSHVCAGVLAAASRGHPQAVTAFLLEGVAPHTLQALLRSWLAAQQGAHSGADAGDATGPAGGGGDLLFYVSTEGDAAAAGAAATDDEDAEGEEDGGLDLAALPGSDSDDGGSQSGGDDSSLDSEA